MAWSPKWCGRSTNPGSTGRRVGFQELMSAPGIDPAKLTSSVAAERDACVLFADGLRFDVGAVLQERLEAQGFRVRMSHRIAPIPTVTATAKPVASPAHAACSGKADAEDFAPVIASNNQPAIASRLRDAMARAGVEILDQDQARMAVSSEAGGWTETGKLDALGHSLEALLVRQIDPEIDVLLDRITGLLSAGWSRVRVVTDHGWLLLPGGLPKVELSPHLVATKWSRCAAVKGGSTPNIPTYPWYWNPVLRIASPPGIGAFVANTEYAHGGISLQECVIPDLVVERGEETIAAAINLGGSIEMIPNAVRIAELAIDKQAQTLLMPVSARRQLNDLPDELWTKISIEFYKDAADAVFKALVE